MIHTRVCNKPDLLMTLSRQLLIWLWYESFEANKDVSEEKKQQNFTMVKLFYENWNLTCIKHVYIQIYESHLAFDGFIAQKHRTGQTAPRIHLTAIWWYEC